MLDSENLFAMLSVKDHINIAAVTYKAICVQRSFDLFIDQIVKIKFH